MNKSLKKLIALFLVIILIGANLAILGEYTIVHALSDEELNEQTTSTNHRNVEFNSYFYGGVHNQVFDIGSEDAKLYINIKVNNAGYLENGTIEFQNTNFKLKEGITDSNIQSIDTANNKIVLNQLNNGSNITIELPIEILENDNVSLDYFNKETLTKFTGTYIDGEGEENSIEKSVSNKLSWNGTAEAELTIESTKYTPYSTNGSYGIIAQTKINSNIKDSTLPIKSTNIEVTVPTINGMKPTDVKVIATNTEATNGKTDGLEFTSNNYMYDAESGKVTINTSNLLDSISWKKDVKDEYLVTYIFEGQDTDESENVDGIDTVATAESNIVVYNSEEFTVNNSAEASIEYTEAEGTITDFAIFSSSDISKGYIYANYDTDSKVETEYYTKYVATVNSAELTTSIEFIQGHDKFLRADDSEESTTVSGNNYAYNKRIEISQAVFNKMLGEDGEIVVKDEEGQELGKINKESTLENGIYLLDISSHNNNKVTITTSAPITEGQLEVNIVKAIKGDIAYSKQQMKSFTKMRVDLEGKTNTTTYTAWREILLKEPETKVELEISKSDLTTVVKNENVEIRVVLNTSSVYNALFENPTIKITFPSYIEEIDLKSTNILLDKGLKIKSSEVVDENGHKVINVTLEGVQTEYAIDAEYKGAIVVLNTDITTNTLTPTGTDKITMEFINNNEESNNAEGALETEIDYVAPAGVVAANGISNYKEGASELFSISDEEQIAELDTYSEKRVSTIKGTVINNYSNDISNIIVLGRIPAQGNKKIDTDTELGSTFTIPLSAGIGISGIDASNYKVYYSDNANATKDLEDSSNGWNETATTSSKSFMIVFNTEYKMSSGSKFDFMYEVEIPENLTANNSSYSMYKVYYDNNSDIGTISENKISSIIRLTTGEGPELEAELSSTAEVIREGQIVKMKVTVKNVGDVDAENVKVNVPLPENTTFMEYSPGNGFYEEEENTKVIDAGTIKVGESAQVSYYIKVDDYLDDETSTNSSNGFPKEITNTAYITGDEIEGRISSNDCVFNVEEGKIYIAMASDTSESQVLIKGQTIEYLISLYNISSMGDLTNTIVIIPLPEGIKYKSAVIKDNWSSNEESTEGISYDENSNTVTVDIGTLSIHKLIILQVEVEEYEGDISIMASAKADNTEEHYSNITEYIAEEVKLEVSELTSSPRYVKEGNIVTYSMKLTNTGTSVARNIKVRNELPEELNFDKATYIINGQESTVTSLTNGIVEISISQLASGDSVEINIMGKAKLLPDANEKEIQNKMTITAKGMESIETNTVTNIIEYNDEIHNQGGDPSDPSNPSNNRYKITGTAWLDDNMDGKRDSNEQRLSNIQVILLSKAGNSIVKDPDSNEEKITTTSDNGTYQFNNLPNGEYLVVFVYDSSNYSLTEYQKSGVDGSFNSDVIDINLTLNGERRIAGITDIITVNGENVRDIDIGLYATNKFDLRLDKYINKITLTTPTIGTRVDEYRDSQVSRIEVLDRNVGQSSAVIEYRIVVTNEGSVPGYVNKIVDYLPKEVNFNTELNTDWYLSDNGNIYNSSLANEKINPGETKEVTLVVSIRITEDLIFSTINNSAEIYESYNEQGLQDVDSTTGNEVKTEDDMSKADVVVSLVTGSQIIVYVLIALGIIVIVGFGIFGIKKYVLNKKV